eukprot:6040031-Prymnesium_polylepis.1
MAPFSAPRSPHIKPRRWEHLHHAFCALRYSEHVRCRFPSEWVKPPRSDPPRPWARVGWGGLGRAKPSPTRG